jgi:hypothetical protein
MGTQPVRLSSHSLPVCLSFRFAPSYCYYGWFFRFFPVGLPLFPGLSLLVLAFRLSPPFRNPSYTTFQFFWFPAFAFCLSGLGQTPRFTFWFPFSSFSLCAASGLFFGFRLSPSAFLVSVKLPGSPFGFPFHRSPFVLQVAFYRSLDKSNIHILKG